jgi:hypothetical protein
MRHLDRFIGMLRDGGHTFSQQFPSECVPIIGGNVVQEIRSDYERAAAGQLITTISVSRHLEIIEAQHRDRRTPYPAARDSDTAAAVSARTRSSAVIATRPVASQTL